MDQLQQENQQLRLEIQQLKKELDETKLHLKKYTAPARGKRFYESHKEVIKEKVKEYLTPEKKKEYNKRYYDKKKQQSVIQETV